MIFPLLSTKLFRSPERPNLIVRPRLIGRLNNGLQGKLILVSAPPGFGKTTLLSGWINDCGRPVAWLSLDKEDGDLTRFLVYLITALQTINSTIGKVVLNTLQSPQPPSINTILTILLNDIATLSENFIIVLDDYHTIESNSVDNALTFLIDHLPSQMHLVIATREDPHLPLAGLRARGQLTEFRDSDLRFSLQETAEFLNQMMSLNLSLKEITALESRTEGWITGLQLAAISMQGLKDSSSFIKSFTGSHRFVLDYLVEEVLHNQTNRVRNFLLQTSILTRLCGPLCNAITKQEDGKEMLETLERGNLFVVPLDDRRQWYRYHHLFADVLQVYSMNEHPEQMPILHRRASDWYEQNGFRSDAVHHAFAANDYERAADLIELSWPVMDMSFQSATWLSWVKALPDDMVRNRPMLSAGSAWALLDGGEMEAAEVQLKEAERWLELIDNPDQAMESSLARMVVVDENQIRLLPAIISTARAYLTQTLGDIPGSIVYAHQALKHTPENDHLRRSQATALLGLAQYTMGNLDEADQSLNDFMTYMVKIDNVPAAISTSYVLIEIKIALGRLNEAINNYERALQLTSSLGESIPFGMADLYRSVSEVYIERGDLDTATQLLMTCTKLSEQTSITDWQHRFCLTQSRMKIAQGDLDGALHQLDEAERLYVRNPLPEVRPIAAMKARIWLAQGRLTEAQRWVREQGLSVDDDLSYIHEFEHITLARIFIAEYKNNQEDGSIQKALKLLERLLFAAEEMGRMGSVIEILVLKALAHEAQGNNSLALVPLERAQALAQQEGYVRVFVEEGLPIAKLLREAAKKGGASNYVTQLLNKFGKTEGARSGSQPLIEPLSERELEVLRLLRTDLNGPDMARQLIISLNTLHTHTKNIYNKLGVNNRRAAVRRAEEQKLI